MENKFDDIRKSLEHLEDEHKLYRQRIAKLENALSEMIHITEEMSDPKKKEECGRNSARRFASVQRSNERFRI